MRDRALKSTGRSVLLAAMLVLMALGARPHGQAGAPSVIFVLEDNRMWPVMQVDHGKFLPSIDGSADVLELVKFADTSYRKGRKYDVFFGGAVAGSAVVTGDSHKAECAQAQGQVQVSIATPFNRSLRVIATDNINVKRPRSRRAATADERAQAIRLATAAYQSNGVSAALAATLIVVNLTAIEVDASAKPLLIGTFVVKKTTGVETRDQLFLIAEAGDGGFRQVIANYEHTSADKIMEGSDIDWVGVQVYAEKLVDHLDLDNDGTSEILTEIAGLEGNNYTLYKKTDGRWTPVLKTYHYRCAF